MSDFVLQLTGRDDPDWDAAQEESELSIDTRLIGAEDIYWDSDGIDEQTSFIDRNGGEHALTLINARHVPLPQNVASSVGGNMNVADALIYLAENSSTDHSPTTAGSPFSTTKTATSAGTH